MPKLFQKVQTRIQLWLWDLEYADVLALAERRQTILIGEGRKSRVLQIVIDSLHKERENIGNKDIEGRMK